MTTDIVTLPNERFLNRETVLSGVLKIMEPELVWLNYVPQHQVDSRSVSYLQDLYNASSDPKKKKPRRITEEGEWSYVDISEVSIKSAVLNQHGFAVRISRDAIRFKQGEDEIQRAFNRIGYWLAQDYDSKVAAALTGNARDPASDGWAVTATWDDATATPVDDLRRLKHAMRREGYPYRMTDTFVDETNYAEAEGYLTSLDISSEKQRTIYGTPVGGGDLSLNIPIAGCVLHGLLSDITHGYVLAIDRNNPAATTFFNNDPMFAPPTIQYQRSDGTTVTVPNQGLHMHKYFDDNKHSTVIQLWWDNATVVKEPYAVLYGSGL